MMCNAAFKSPCLDIAECYDTKKTSVYIYIYPISIIHIHLFSSWWWCIGWDRFLCTLIKIGPIIIPKITMETVSWSYAWASGDPWYVMLPSKSPVFALLSVMIIRRPWCKYWFALSQSSISLLLSKTDEKMPHLVPILGTHPVRWNSYSWTNYLHSLEICSLYLGNWQYTPHRSLLPLENT